ncbi:MAG: hypothetical protein JWQ36_3352 [Enterovirga sp.]|nr:hypothetical protein [Enterovirga sp.]
MIPETWFRKTKAEQIPAKDDPAKAELSTAPAVEAPACAPTDEAAKVESVAAPAAEKDGARPDVGLRASRLVEAGRKRSTDLTSRARALLAGAEPWGKPAAAAAAILVVGALGYAGGHASADKTSSQNVLALRLSETSAGIRENREDVARLASEMKSVRTALDGLRSERRVGDGSAKQAQLIERASAEASAKIAKLGEQLDRMEKTQRDPARIASIVERLERIEKQVQTAALAAPTAPKPVAAASNPAPVAAAADVTTTGSLPAVEARPPARPVEAVDPRKLPAEGYVLRDIEDGFALVEGRNGRFFEVTAGMNLPGLGRVEAIERRGRQWVVVTPKGYVAER